MLASEIMAVCHKLFLLYVFIAWQWNVQFPSEFRIVISPSFTISHSSFLCVLLLSFLLHAVSPICASFFPATFRDGRYTPRGTMLLLHRLTSVASLGGVYMVAL